MKIGRKNLIATNSRELQNAFQTYGPLKRTWKTNNKNEWLAYLFYDENETTFWEGFAWN